MNQKVIYKRNHYMPKCILKYWVTKPGKYHGVYVFDIREQRRYFANATGNKAFPFAIAEDLYIPIVNDVRAVNMEKWFSDMEGPLSSFIEQIARKHDQLVLRNEDDIIKLTKAICGLEMRSRYNIELIKDALSQLPQLRCLVSANPERDVSRLALENLIHYVTNQASKFYPPEMEIVVSEHDSFLLCDRPFVNNPRLEYRFLVLTNRVMVVYKQSSVGQFTYRYLKSTPDLINMLNREIALQARDWIVSDNEESLKKYERIIFSKDWIRCKTQDKLTFELPKYLTSGWSIER